MWFILLHYIVPMHINDYCYKPPAILAMAMLSFSFIQVAYGDSVDKDAADDDDEEEENAPQEHYTGINLVYNVQTVKCVLQLI